MRRRRFFKFYHISVRRRRFILIMYLFLMDRSNYVPFLMGRSTFFVIMYLSSFNEKKNIGAKRRAKNFKTPLIPALPRFFITPLISANLPPDSDIFFFSPLMANALRFLLLLAEAAGSPVHLAESKKNKLLFL